MKTRHVRNAKSGFLLKSNSASPQCLATPFTVKGVKWEIHNHDADINNPSCPHMHAIGKSWKLDLYTGNIYESGSGILVGQVKRDELLAIWNAKGVYKIILAERALYEELHRSNPTRYPSLPPLLVSPANKKQKIKVDLRKNSVNAITMQKEDSIVVEIRKNPLQRKLGHITYRGFPRNHN